jgi:hypothetical protein
LNLEYLENADIGFFKKHKKHAGDAMELFETKSIDYFPRDYQKMDDKNEVIYFYNADNGHWDSKM